MRKKMEDHRVRPDCVQCHRLMDPIGFALENFDATGSWRTQDEEIHQHRLSSTTPRSGRPWSSATGWQRTIPTSS